MAISNYIGNGAMKNATRSRAALLNLLHNGLRMMKQSYCRTIESQLLHHIELIWHKRKQLNIAHLHDMDSMIFRNLLNSLSMAPFIKTSSTILDVGTGVGFPGIPLAITMPNQRFVLLDCNYRKIQFLHLACYQLQLNNIQIAYKRIENFTPDNSQLFSSVVCRCFGIFPQLLFQIQPVLAPHAQILVMKGIYPKTEIQQIKNPFQLINVHPIHIPYVNGEHHLLEIIYNPTLNK